MKVSILGLNKADVLRTLYNYALFAVPNYEFNNPLSILVRSRPLVSRQSAEVALSEAALQQDYYFESLDLGQGLRPLYVNLSNNEIDVDEYDLHHGLSEPEQGSSFSR